MLITAITAVICLLLAALVELEPKITESIAKCLDKIDEITATRRSRKKVKHQFVDINKSGDSKARFNKARFNKTDAKLFTDTIVKAQNEIAEINGYISHVQALRTNSDIMKRLPVLDLTIDSILKEPRTLINKNELIYNYLPNLLTLTKNSYTLELHNIKNHSTTETEKMSISAIEDLLKSIESEYTETLLKESKAAIAQIRK